MTKRICSGLVAVLALTLVAGPAHADSKADADAAAELARAKDLDSHGDHRNACKAYQHASELAQGRSTASLIGLSYCHTQAKEGDKAVAVARQALAVAATPDERTEATMTLGFDLLRQGDDPERLEALDLFKQRAAASGETKDQGEVLTALLTLHRDRDAAELLEDLRKQGKSRDDIQQALFRISYPGSFDDPAANDFNRRLHGLAPDAPLRVGSNVARPELRHQVKPGTTEEARHHHGFSGTVILETIIDTEGRVTNVRVLRGVPMGLTEAAVDAVKQWTFKPATLDGQPVKVFYVLTVNFQIS
jgi:TonB family protein